MSARRVAGVAYSGRNGNPAYLTLIANGNVRDSLNKNGAPFVVRHGFPVVKFGRTDYMYGGKIRVTPLGQGAFSRPNSKATLVSGGRVRHYTVVTAKLTAVNKSLLRHMDALETFEGLIVGETKGFDKGVDKTQSGASAWLSSSGTFGSALDGPLVYGESFYADEKFRKSYGLAQDGLVEWLTSSQQLMDLGSLPSFLTEGHKYPKTGLFCLYPSIDSDSLGQCSGAKAMLFQLAKAVVADLSPRLLTLWDLMIRINSATLHQPSAAALAVVVEANTMISELWDSVGALLQYHGFDISAVSSWPIVLRRGQEVGLAKPITTTETDGVTYALRDATGVVARTRDVRASPVFLNMLHAHVEERISACLHATAGYNVGHPDMTGSDLAEISLASTGYGTDEVVIDSTDLSNFDRSHSTTSFCDLLVVLHRAGIVEPIHAALILMSLTAPLLTVSNVNSSGALSLLKCNKTGQLDSGHKLTTVGNTLVNMLWSSAKIINSGRRLLLIHDIGGRITRPVADSFVSDPTAVMLIVKGDDLVALCHKERFSTWTLPHDEKFLSSTTSDPGVVFLQYYYDYPRVVELPTELLPYGGHLVGVKRVVPYTGIINRRLDRLYRPERPRMDWRPTFFAMLAHLVDCRYHPFYSHLVAAVKRLAVEMGPVCVALINNIYCHEESGGGVFVRISDVMRPVLITIATEYAASLQVKKNDKFDYSAAIQFNTALGVAGAADFAADFELNGANSAAFNFAESIRLYAAAVNIEIYRHAVAARTISEILRVLDLMNAVNLGVRNSLDPAAFLIDSSLGSLL